MDRHKDGWPIGMAHLDDDAFDILRQEQDRLSVQYQTSISKHGELVGRYWPYNPDYKREHDLSAAEYIVDRMARLLEV